MKRRSLLIGLTLAPLACGGGSKAEAPRTAVETAPVEIRTIVVERAGGDARWMSGGIRPRTRATLAARVSAAVAQVTIREGDAVAKGATLVVLDDAPLRAAVAAAETRVAAASEDDRRMRALKQRDAATQREVDEAGTRLETARAGLAAANDALESAVIRAPFAGRVAARHVQPGDLALPGSPLVDLHGFDALELVVAVEGSVASVLRTASVVQVHVDGVDAPVAAKVRSFAPSADPSTHRVDVLCDLEAARGIRAGAFARVLIPSGPAVEGAPTVPASSVVRRGGLVGVFVVEGGRARLRWIALGAETAGRYEVRSGLRAGEAIAESPRGLVDGAAVRVTETP